RNLNRRVAEARAVPSYAPTPRRNNDSDFRIGQSVAHAKFGAGVILDVEGRGAEARVQVKFRDVGVKWLALAYAKLTPG
ncbi:MAG TPA: DNA helicase II, partial [Thiobacillaceae bacterium]|nr:DNA helicase II [Thiobacillaceae bacterium]